MNQETPTMSPIDTPMTEQLALLADTEVLAADDAVTDGRASCPACWLRAQRLAVGRQIVAQRRAGTTNTPAYAALVIRRAALLLAMAETVA